MFLKKQKKEISHVKCLELIDSNIAGIIHDAEFVLTALSRISKDYSYR